MTNDKPMVPITILDISKLAEPVNTLINRVSDAIGVVFEPRHMRRNAQAEIDVHRMKQEAGLEPLTSLEKRSLQRMVSEEVKHQVNIENILVGAMDYLSDQSKPEDLDDDWISFFFAQCRTVSNEDFQKIWSRLLGVESHKPGSISRRTIAVLGTMGKKDAELFAGLFPFLWNVNNNLIPLIENLEDPFLKQRGINLLTLEHLDSIGLLKFSDIGGKSFNGVPGGPLLIPAVHVATECVYIFEMPASDQKVHKFSIGKCILTDVGREMATLANAEVVEGFVDQCVENWEKAGWTVKQINKHETDKTTESTDL